MDLNRHLRPARGCTFRLPEHHPPRPGEGSARLQDIGGHSARGSGPPRTREWSLDQAVQGGALRVVPAHAGGVSVSRGSFLGFLWDFRLHRPART